MSWDNLAAINRRIIEPIANRYFFVADPIPMYINGYDEEFTAEIPLHPDYPERGFRRLTFRPDRPVYVSKDDMNLLKPGNFVRLKDLFNVEILEVGEDGIKARFHSVDYEVAKKNKWRMVHWLTEGKPCEVWVPDGEELMIRQGLLESNAEVRVDDIVQFERFGFVRIDEIKDGKVRAIFAHS